MKAVILCGGLGTRLHPLTDIVPKSLIPFNGKAFLEYIVGEILSLVDEVVIVYRGDNTRYKIALDKYSSMVQLRYIEQSDEDYGTFVPIKKCDEMLEDDLLIVNGDTLVKSREIEELLRHFNDCGKSICLSIIARSPPPKSARVVVAKNDGAKLEEHNPTTFSPFYNCGVYVMRNGAVEECIVTQSVVTGEYEFTDLINFYCDREDCCVKIITDPYVHINEPSDLVKSIRAIREFTHYTKEGDDDNCFYCECGSEIEDGAIIKDSYIYNTKVAKGQVIKNACVVNGVVIYEE